MKILATALGTAATAQSLDDRGSVTAWVAIEDAYSSLYDAILSAYSDAFSCSYGEWETYSVEVRQISGSGDVEYVTKIGDTTLHSSRYSASALPAGLDLQVFVASDFNNAATNYGLRNFYYQTFDPCATRTDPCTDLASCTTVVDSCEFNPVDNVAKTVVSAAANYKVSADILCPDRNAWTNMVHLTSDPGAFDDTSYAGNRQFTVKKSPDAGSMEVSFHDPNWTNKRYYFRQLCTVGEWNTYSLEVNQVEGDPSTLRWIFRFDGTQSRVLDKAKLLIESIED
ncbi:Oidioi.mRNA.OKI2018_I69.chr1.g1254.t1.cds [Oikopleura dioica]|uniref:Oidioi.mRNA.OKI2018_I69.chr1.g1254.t1.cds n=1 Tax=Oikopleura dioica TaxID=34765 RepID=A0ABN7SSK1_OIKDI|nr:Oidioi.mRNA.OKI2018_I69.chr1.g1254.t1.cds [Oikopleura dioica]